MINQLDKWHGQKQFQKGAVAISSGPLKNKNKTWSPRLSDKVNPLRTHTYYALQNCAEFEGTVGEKAEILRRNLLLPLKHYKNNHSECFETARCRTDPNYQPSRVMLDEKASELLETFLKHSNLYTKAEMYVYNMDTFHLESLFNTLNIWRDKRISYLHSCIGMRMPLEKLQEFGSDVDGNKLGKAKKWFTASTYLFAYELWSKVIAQVLEKVGY